MFSPNYFGGNILKIITSVPVSSRSERPELLPVSSGCFDFHLRSEAGRGEAKLTFFRFVDGDAAHDVTGIGNGSASRDVTVRLAVDKCKEGHSHVINKTAQQDPSPVLKTKYCSGTRKARLVYLVCVIKKILL
jgi:hypothetical protein